MEPSGENLPDGFSYDSKWSIRYNGYEGGFKMRDNSTVSIDDYIDDVRDFLPKLLDASEHVARILYKSMEEESWRIFGELVQGMDDLYRTVQIISQRLTDECKEDLLVPYLTAFITDMAKNFSEMNKFMDEERFAEASDCIRYGLFPVFSDLAIVLGENNHSRRSRLKTNLTYLAERFPRAHAQIQAMISDSRDYRILASRNGSPNVYISNGNNGFVNFYSQYEPEYEADCWVEQIALEVDGKRNVVFYGFGLGYHLSAFMHAYPEAYVHVYEPDIQLFMTTMEVVDLKPIFDRPQMKDFVVGQDKDHRDGLFYRLLKYGKGETAMVTLPNYGKLNSEWKLQFAEDAKNAINNYISSENVYDQFGLEWTRNSLYNMSYNITTPSIDGLRGKFAGLPAVVVGAGPSLEADIELLRVLKRHALIIAAGSTIQSLQHFGIDPHLVVSMDGGFANHHVFRNVDITNIALLYVPQVEHRVIENTSNHLVHVFFNTDVTTMYLAGIREGDPVFRSSHSVTGTAIQAAAFMGCNEIIFTGQDLSYPDERIYADGAQHADIDLYRHIMDRAVLQVENVQGGSNRTTESMRLTLVDIEEIISLFPHIRFTNTSKNGAKIKHTEWESMVHVLERLKGHEMDSSALITAMDRHLVPYPSSRREEMAERVRSLMYQLADFEISIKRIKRNMGKLPELSRMKPERCINLMVDIEKDWESVVKTIIFNTFFIVLIKKEVTYFDRELPEVAAESNLIKKAKLFVDVVGRLVNAIDEKISPLKEMIDEAVRRVDKQMDALKEIDEYVQR
jgi:hypothetical protein